MQGWLNKENEKLKWALDSVQSNINLIKLIVDKLNDVEKAMKLPKRRAGEMENDLKSFAKYVEEEWPYVFTNDQSLTPKEAGF